MAQQMVVQQPPEPVAVHRQLAHLAADHHPAAPGTGCRAGTCPAGRGQQGGVGGKDTQQQSRPLEATPLSVQTIEDSAAPEPVLLGQGHSGAACSDRQAGATPAATGTDDPPAGVGPHSHPEP